MKTLKANMNILLGVLVVMALAVGIPSCYTNVEPGFVGILVRKTGSHRGVDKNPQYGRVWEGWNEDVVVFPVTLQNVIWTKSPHEGSPTDESITFSVQGGVPINVDVGETFRVEPARAADMYLRYHIVSLEALGDGEIRNVTRDCLAHEAASMEVDELLGGGRNTLLESARACVRGRLGPYGLLVENLTFVSAPRLPDNVQRAINASLEAQQRLVQAEASARAARATAEGEAAANLIVAGGRQAAARINATSDAEALLIRTRADLEQRRLMAQAYRELQSTLTPGLLQYLWVQKWNGVVPVGSSGSNLMVPLHP